MAQSSSYPQPHIRDGLAIYMITDLLRVINIHYTNLCTHISQYPQRAPIQVLQATAHNIIPGRLLTQEKISATKLAS